MNTYTTEFHARCPHNGIRIKYRLRIETAKVIPVEWISAAVESVDDVFHEEIADNLAKQFAGLHTLTADHHGVTIETTRKGAEK